MTKLLVAFAFVPFVAGCAATPTGAVKTAEECRMVSHEDTGSKIKAHRECTSPSDGSSVQSRDQSKSLPAPQ